MKKKRPKRLKYKMITINKGWFKNQHKKKTEKCLICNSFFKFYPSKRIQKYCSIKCYRISQKGRKRPNHSKLMEELHKKGIVRSDGFKGKTHTIKERKKVL